MYGVLLYVVDDYFESQILSMNTINHCCILHGLKIINRLFVFKVN